MGIGRCMVFLRTHCAIGWWRVEIYNGAGGRTALAGHSSGALECERASYTPRESPCVRCLFPRRAAVRVSILSDGSIRCEGSSGRGWRVRGGGCERARRALGRVPAVCAKTSKEVLAFIENRLRLSLRNELRIMFHHHRAQGRAGGVHEDTEGKARGTRRGALVRAETGEKGFGGNQVLEGGGLQEARA